MVAAKMRVDESAQWRERERDTGDEGLKDELDEGEI